jgi:hypothetical protein
MGTIIYYVKNIYVRLMICSSNVCLLEELPRGEEIHIRVLFQHSFFLFHFFSPLTLALAFRHSRRSPTKHHSPTLRFHRFIPSRRYFFIKSTNNVNLL